MSIGLKAFMALSIMITVSSVALSAPGEINSVNDGREIQGGVYFNRAGSKTVFRNSGDGGLWLPSTRSIRGVETKASGVPTGNGGTLHFRAPKSVIRLDGSVDVSALQDGALFTGKGGKVTVYAAYLYQNGQIIANGKHGGSVNYNVIGATFGPQARVFAMGNPGNGGKISIKGTGVVDLQRGSIMDTRGRVLGGYSTNVISVKSGMVNSEGLLQAVGAVAGQNGGRVQLVSYGKTDIVKSKAVINSVNTAPGISPLLTAEETNAIFAQLDYLQGRHDGHIHHLGTIRVNGADGLLKGKAANGGQILVKSAAGHFHNHGLLQANGGYGTDTGTGGRGGTITVNSPFHILNEERSMMQANGGNGLTGGKGGIILLNAKDNVVNFAEIHADGGIGQQGGKGGKVTLHANRLLNMTGPVTANGGTGDSPGAYGTVNFTGTTNIQHDPNDDGMSGM
jgi:hypothetical protein